MKIPVKCTSAMGVISPKPEDNFTTYRFALEGRSEEKMDHGYFEGGLYMNLKAGLFEVGKKYDVRITMENPDVRKEDGTAFVPGAM